MATAPQVSPAHRSVDAAGRAIPLSPEEALRRAEEGLRALDAIRALVDPDEDQAHDLDELIRAIDAEPLSDRERFGG